MVLKNKRDISINLPTIRADGRDNDNIGVGGGGGGSNSTKEVRHTKRCPDRTILERAVTDHSMKATTFRLAVFKDHQAVIRCLFDDQTEGVGESLILDRAVGVIKYLRLKEARFSHTYGLVSVENGILFVTGLNRDEGTVK